MKLEQAWGFFSTKRLRVYPVCLLDVRGMDIPLHLTEAALRQAVACNAEHVLAFDAL